MKTPSISLILSGLFVAYIANFCWSMYQLYSVPKCTRETGPCLPSYLNVQSDYRLWLCSSPHATVRAVRDIRKVHEWDDFDYLTPFETTINVSLSDSVRNNGSLYAHVYLIPRTSSTENIGVVLHNPYVTVAVGSLTVHAVPADAEYKLLETNPIPTGKGQKSAAAAATAQVTPTTPNKAAVATTHWHSRLVINVVDETMDLPRKGLPEEIAHFLSLTPRGHYLPGVYIDTFSNRIKDLTLVTKNMDEISLTVVYSPMSFGKFRLWTQLSAAMNTLKSLGFKENDIDETKGIFIDTNLYLLCLTFIVAALHMLFDFLAFKNDILFWKRRKTMVGLSIRTVVWQCFSHMVIFLYLLNEKTSLLVLVPSGIAVIIEIWKLFRAFKVDVSLRNFVVTFGSSTDKEKETEAYDAEIMKYLSYLLYPLCIGGALYSLLYMSHKSWYSWCINSLVNGVYAFGFLFMLPQLFVNYKLKSIAHLPFRAFMYKAFNTFIDDIFAFIITMPVSHRVACFRDDIAFLIYLYQRWLYPVDKSRINEFGESFEETKEANKKTD